MTDETTFGALHATPPGAFIMLPDEPDISPIQVKEHAILDDLDDIWRRVLVLRACIADTTQRIAEARGLEAKRGAQLAELEMLLGKINATCRGDKP